MLSPWSLAHKFTQRSLASFCTPLYFQFTDTLCAEPLKKKKRIDPAVIKQREERKRKRIEKQIRRLEKNAQQLKPISECEIPIELINSVDSYNRNVAQTDDKDFKILAVKQWSRFKYWQNIKDTLMIERIQNSHQNALNVLKHEYPHLYLSAINKTEDNILPWKASGPAETPPLKGYESPDGEYSDISKKWDHI